VSAPTREELEGLALSLEGFATPTSDERARIAELLRAYPVGERVEGSAWKEWGDDEGWSFHDRAPLDGDKSAVLYVDEEGEWGE